MDQRQRERKRFHVWQPNTIDRRTEGAIAIAFAVADDPIRTFTLCNHHQRHHMRDDQITTPTKCTVNKTTNCVIFYVIANTMRSDVFPVDISLSLRCLKFQNSANKLFILLVENDVQFTWNWICIRGDRAFGSIHAIISRRIEQRTTKNNEMK